MRVRDASAAALRRSHAADRGVDLLGFGRPGDLAGADGPDGLVGDGDVPVTLRDVVEKGADLTLDDLERVAALALGQRLADAHDGDERRP